MIWTVENTATLRDMWSEGFCARAIAEKLGATRNSVIGKVHRLALPNPELKLPFTAGVTIIPHFRTIKPKPRVPHKRKLQSYLVTPVLRRTQSPYRFIYERGRARDLAPEHPFTEVPFLARRRGQCVWPTSGSGLEMYCCGAPAVDKRSYCHGHYERSINAG